MRNLLLLFILLCACKTESKRQREEIIFGEPDRPSDTIVAYPLTDSMIDATSEEWIREYNDSIAADSLKYQLK